MKFAYVGNCKDTVDVLQFWDATEMAQVIEGSKEFDINRVIPFIFDTDGTDLKRRVELHPDKFECGINARDNNDAYIVQNCDIVWLYDSVADIHYFFEMYI